MTARLKLRSLLRITVLVAVLAVVAGLLRLPVVAPAAAAAAPVVTDPATVTYDADRCSGAIGCFYRNGWKILDPVTPVGPDDQAGVGELQSAATRMFVEMHKGLSIGDPRIVKNAETEVRGIMWQLVRTAITTAPSSRSELQKDVYHWFQTVVRDYQLAAAKAARTEYDLWTAQQCAYMPPTAVPAYYSGLGCNPDRSGLQSLTQGALSPTVEQFTKWGAYTAGQKLTSPRDTSSGRVYADNATASLQASQVLAQTVGTEVAIAVDLATVALDWMGAGGATMAGPATSQVAARLGILLDSFLAPAMVAAGPLILAAALFSIVMGTIQQVENAKIPGLLDGAVAAAGQLPDLQTWLGDADKQALLYTLFLGQTAINNVNKPEAGRPDWHGDLLRVRAADSGGNPLEPGTSGKAVSLRSPAGAGATVTFLTDLGFFQTSTDGGTSWLTTPTLDYVAWDGSAKSAHLYGSDRFYLSGGDGSCSTGCGIFDRLEALDANGDRVIVTLQPQRAVTATIQSSDTTFRAGETTTFEAPATDPPGTTYTWMFESRPSAQSIPGFTLCQFDPVTFMCDGAFHDNPAVTKSGRSVTYTWPKAGTYHVRLITTNGAGQTSKADRDVTVVAGDAPTLDVITKSLGPMRPGSIATIAGCLNTSPGDFALPKVTIDWGDGTTESAQPPAGLVVIGYEDKPEPTFVVKPGGIQGFIDHCSGDWSFRASHTYTSSSSDEFPIVLTAEDGDGQSVTDTSMTARLGPQSISAVEFGPTNATETSNGEWGMPRGAAIFDAGEEVDMRVRFDVSPYATGYRHYVVFRWGDGLSTSFFRPGLSCDPDCETTFEDSHAFQAKPGARGIGAYTFTALLLDGDGDVVSQYTQPIVVRTQAPTVTNVVASPSPVDIGNPVTISGDVSLPTNGPSPVQVTVGWSRTAGATGGPGTQTVTLPPGSTHFAVTQPGYVMDGYHDIDVTVADNAGGVTTKSVRIWAANVAPTPSVDPVEALEGTPVSLSVDTGAPAGINSYTQIVDWGDGSAPSVTSYGPTATGSLPTPQHTYAEAGTYTVTVRLVDGNGGVGETTTTATVGAAAPTVTLEDGTGQSGATVTLRGTIADPGSVDTFTGTVDWRDGSAPESFTRSARGSFTLEHTYTRGGVFAPVVTVSDQHDNASPEASAVLTVDGPPAFTGPTYSTPSGLSVDAPEGKVGLAYSFAVGVSGYPAPSVSLASGTLPPGLSLDEHGILSGVPTTTGDYAFRLTATNTHGSATSAGPVEITIGTAPVLSPVTVDAATGVALSRQLAGSGFPAPTYTSAGTLPPGVTLTTAGRLAGTPQSSGTWTFTVTASNFVDESSAPVTIRVRMPQDVRFTSTPPSSAVVGATYTPVATGGASANPVQVRSTTPAVCSMTGAVVTFLQPGGCALEARQAGSATHLEGIAVQSILVGKAATSTTLGVGRDELTTTVAVLAPGAGDPTGDVVFRVDGTVVGRVPVAAGTATLAYQVPSGARREVSATYSGDDRFAMSSASTARQDPRITAALSSAQPVNRFGWYRTTVTVTFTCTERGAALTEPCPAPVTLTRDGAAQSVSRTVNATDGGAGTVATPGISIDRTDPTVAVRGTLARPRCVASDVTSGIASCELTTSGKRGNRVTATAIDRAGNKVVVTRRF